MSSVKIAQAYRYRENPAWVTGARDLEQHEDRDPERAVRAERDRAEGVALGEFPHSGEDLDDTSSTQAQPSEGS